MFGWDFEVVARDSEDEIWSIFVFLIWPKVVTLVSRTHPSDPLCLWQCFRQRLWNWTLTAAKIVGIKRSRILWNCVVFYAVDYEHAQVAKLWSYSPAEDHWRLIYTEVKSQPIIFAQSPSVNNDPITFLFFIGSYLYSSNMWKCSFWVFCWRCKIVKLFPRWRPLKVDIYRCTISTDDFHTWSISDQ